jgi:hypothetical protein
MMPNSPANTIQSATSLITQERLVHVGPHSIGTVGTGRRDDSLRQSAAYSLVQLVHSIFKKIGRNEEALPRARFGSPNQPRARFPISEWTSRSRAHVIVNIHNSLRRPSGRDRIAALLVGYISITRDSRS